MTATNGSTQQLSAGVIGVGSMGRHHARVYTELPGVSLVGVTDVDSAAAESVADEYGTQAKSREELLATADLVSIAVPTPYHYETAQACIDNGVDILIEKPFVEEFSEGRALAERARKNDITLQVGHIERFNPATSVLSEIVPELDIVAIDINRLGPPVDRGGDDSVVMDLMIHDIDILLSLVDSDIDSLAAADRDEGYTAVQFQFDDGAIASLTASRLTQQKVRTLSVTARSCRVTVDFISQTVEIHRHSMPEYIESNGDIRFRHESVVERPIVDTGEPLKAELSAFVTAVREGSEPIVTAEDGLRVLEVASEIETPTKQPEPVVNPQ